MEKVKTVILLAAVIALGYFGWRILFPNPERVIRSMLEELAETVSFDSGSGTLVHAYDTSKLIEFFAPDAEGRVEVRGMQPRSFQGRDEIRGYSAFARTEFKSLLVEFLDINVKLGPDKQTAVANLTAKATVNDSPDFWVQEVRFVLRLVDGRWKIYRVETVKVLARTSSDRREEARPAHCEWPASSSVPADA